jgi:Domain of unknown function DUF1828
MICQQLTNILGFDCSPLTDSGDVVLISTPFTFDDGDSLPVFAEQLNGQIRFFDDGQTLMHFIGRGVRIENKKHATFLSTATSKNGTTFTDDGQVEIWSPIERAAEAFSKYLSSMIALSSWERDQQGTDTDAVLFVEEVAMALRAWKPTAQIVLEPSFEGISGRPYRLDFLFEGQAVAVTGAHPNSVSAVLHRLIDIHSRIANSEQKFLVIIDDRNDPDSANREALIVQSVAMVMPFTALEAKSRTGLAVQ